MSDFIFNLENLFSTEQINGCLGQNEAVRFLIPPYQRGYKWSTISKNPLVTYLMKDLLDAFEASANSSTSDYYLQYITVKKEKDKDYLELIDGQQRLTTLTLLFSVLSLHADCENISIDKLTYSIRERTEYFLKEYICNKENLKLLIKSEWDKEKGLEIKDEVFYQQDIFYLFHAVLKIADMLPAEEEIKTFYNFILSKVKLIVNKVEPNVTSERVFRNMNNNRIELSDVDLVKALLLTKTARDKENRTYYEIMEIRAAMGRQWDEIARWVKKDEVQLMLFNSGSLDDGMDDLLELEALKQSTAFDLEYSQGKYGLFNFFLSNIKKGKIAPGQIFQSIKSFTGVFSDWLDNPAIYNLLGYLVNAKDSKWDSQSIISFTGLDKNDLLDELNKEKNKLLPDDISDLSFPDNRTEINRILLATSIFHGNNDESKFDFVRFNSEKWSIEHIFPQNPDLVPLKIGPKDILLLQTLVKGKFKFEFRNEGESQAEYLKMRNQLIKKMFSGKSIKNGTEITPRERELLYKLVRTDKLNNIGNMALLTRSDNSSNSNGMFDTKRLNIVHRISEGSFVPKHTFDVFSKLISDKMTPDLTVWTETDIKAHKEWLKNVVVELKKN